MSVKEIKKEIEYYAGRTATEDEAQEIAFYYNSGCASLDEIISDYYGCI